jgi:hypothetical protein
MHIHLSCLCLLPTNNKAITREEGEFNVMNFDTAYTADIK